MNTVEPMVFHFPGWFLDGMEPSEPDYQVWAPGEIHHQGRPTDTVRVGWQSAWNTDGGNRGDLRKGESMDDVLSLFPSAIAAKFRKIIKVWLDAEPT